MKREDEIDAERIRQHAYELWQQDGCPEGRDQEYWYRAEAALTREAGAGLETVPSGDGAGVASSAADTETTSTSGKRSRGAKMAGQGEDTASATTPEAGQERAGSQRATYDEERRTRKKSEG